MRKDIIMNRVTMPRITDEMQPSILIDENKIEISHDAYFFCEKFSPETITALKKALGYGDVIVKCPACGQWGATKTACKHCGYPIE